MDKEQLLSNYAANLPDSRNRNHYISYARQFLESADALDKEGVVKYLKGLKRQKRSAGTIDFAFRVIRTLFNVNKLDWPFHRGEGPQIGQRDEYKPALGLELIKIMIDATKDGKLDTAPACFLALSTTYGLRREEMCDLEPGDIDLKQSTIFISTVKKGRQRYHLIPVEIKPYLETYDFIKRYRLDEMSQMFWRVVNGSGLEALKPKRLGWHTLRRPLLTGLIENGLNLFAAKAFLRWKSSASELAMPARYYGNVVIGLEGTTVVTEEAKEDKEVFEKYHPFLSLWVKS